jgi:hypothetical protein
MPRPHTLSRLSAGRGIVLLTAMACASSQCGCVNVGMMVGKVFFGDPKMTSVFEQRTGVSLEETQKKVAVVCTAPASVSESFDTLQHDLQEEASRRMQTRGLNVAPSDDVINALESSGGKFDRDALAAALPDADYIVHIDVERCTQTEEASPDMYRGRANGVMYIYEVDRSAGSSGPRVLQLFYQDFNTQYPSSQPIMSDQMSSRMFQSKFVDELAVTLARTFYDIHASEAF